MTDISFVGSRGYRFYVKISFVVPMQTAEISILLEGQINTRIILSLQSIPRSKLEDSECAKLTLARIQIMP